MTTLRKTIAIIGCGPKGLYALDALCQAARDIPSHTFDVHIFEPSPYPGAGPIYDPEQPDILFMNFPAHMIDAWTDGRGPNLLAWLAENGTAVGADDYVPRAMVGRYLAWCFDKVAADVPLNVHLTLHPTEVTGLRPLRGGWKVSPATIVADEVLVSTGHQDWSRKGETNSAEKISSPFPIDAALTRDKVSPGASVICKGFALTFIDTVLALTEGRGGVFTEKEFGYAYQPCGDEPRVIAPFSRTGRPMRAKVEADHFVPPQNGAFWRAQVADLETFLARQPDATFRDDIWPALLRIADSTLEMTPGTSAAFFADWQGAAFDAERCRYELRMGYAVAVGAVPPDICWALGEAWRRCYPVLVRWISHRELSTRDATCFRNTAAEMERLAFGPPAQNVGKLICLEEAGLVSFEHLSGDMSADITIDATIPPAGGAALSQPLTDLLRNDYVSVGALGGVIVNDRAQALIDDIVTPGLSIIGRATEGSVLGNDTLSRTLHDLPIRWAAHATSVTAIPAHPGLEQTA